MSEAMVTNDFQPVVTISASYGAGGSVIAPRLAAELGVPFVDRLISADLPWDAARHFRSGEGLAEGEHADTPAGRFLKYFANAATVGTAMAPAPGVVIEEDDSIRERSEAPLAPVRGGAAAVVLGRAGAVVLASRPRTFHVRLDGPVERRVARAAEIETVGLDAAGRRQIETDRARTFFVKRLYRADSTDPALYHLVLDTTVLGVDRSCRVVAAAAREFFEASAGAR